ANSEVVEEIVRSTGVSGQQAARDGYRAAGRGVRIAEAAEVPVQRGRGRRSGRYQAVGASSGHGQVQRQHRRNQGRSAAGGYRKRAGRCNQRPGVVAQLHTHRASRGRGVVHGSGLDSNCLGSREYQAGIAAAVAAIGLNRSSFTHILRAPRDGAHVRGGRAGVAAHLGAVVGRSGEHRRGVRGARSPRNVREGYVVGAALVLDAAIGRARERERRRAAHADGGGSRRQRAGYRRGHRAGGCGGQQVVGGVAIAHYRGRDGKRVRTQGA
nr:hypothetical protein [Tanacetum cinerariifolium]